MIKKKALDLCGYENKIMNRRIFSNIFIVFIITCSYGFGIFEKFISPGFDETRFSNHLLFKDDTRNVRDQDFWPFSSYPMFSDGYDQPKVSRIEARGILENNQEMVLKISYAFPPLWENGLHRMLKKAIVHKKDIEVILDSLSLYFYHRFTDPNSYDSQYADYSKVRKIEWFVQLWDFEEWLDFRKEHSDLSAWTDFKKSTFSPIYHIKFHSSRGRNE